MQQICRHRNHGNLSCSGASSKDSLSENWKNIKHSNFFHNFRIFSIKIVRLPVSFYPRDCLWNPSVSAVDEIVFLSLSSLSLPLSVPLPAFSSWWQHLSGNLISGNYHLHHPLERRGLAFLGGTIPYKALDNKLDSPSGPIFHRWNGDIDQNYSVGLNRWNMTTWFLCRRIGIQTNQCRLWRSAETKLFVKLVYKPHFLKKK